MVAYERFIKTWPAMPLPRRSGTGLTAYMRTKSLKWPAKPFRDAAVFSSPQTERCFYPVNHAFDGSAYRG